MLTFNTAISGIYLIYHCTCVHIYISVTYYVRIKNCTDSGEINTRALSIIQQSTRHLDNSFNHQVASSAIHICMQLQIIWKFRTTDIASIVYCKSYVYMYAHI